MTVKSLELRDFRNYNMLDIHFDKGTMPRERQMF